MIASITKDWNSGNTSPICAPILLILTKPLMANVDGKQFLYWEVDGEIYCEDCMYDTFYISLDDDGETCDWCGEELEDYSAFKVGNDTICRDCFNEEFRKAVYRYIIGRR